MQGEERIEPVSSMTHQVMAGVFVINWKSRKTPPNSGAFAMYSALK
ncbi:hypothetical protein BMS3Bbin04_00819 [bacterium BMS3Bbin04]|nr:hypothetical protein BMS3Bbin04_00819 [bacterium BMS3Bbin04]